MLVPQVGQAVVAIGPPGIDCFAPSTVVTTLVAWKFWITPWLMKTSEPGGLTLPGAARATSSASSRWPVRPSRASSGSISSGGP